MKKIFMFLTALLSPSLVSAQADFIRQATGFIPRISLQQLVYWIIIGAVAFITIWLALRMIRYQHKVFIIDKRGIGRSDIGRKLKKDHTNRLQVMRAKANLTWPNYTIALTKKRNFIPLIEDDAGNLHNIMINWDAQAVTSEGEFVKVRNLYLKTPQRFIPINKLKFVNKTGKEVIFQDFPLLQPADTNVMREFIQNNKETIQTYHKPSQLERLAPYLAFATVVVVSAVYWFVVARWH